jgi:hypothetical protein
MTSTIGCTPADALNRKLSSFSMDDPVNVPVTEARPKRDRAVEYLWIQSIPTTTRRPRGPTRRQ